MGVADAGSPRIRSSPPEIALLRKLLARDAPVLGICLGLAAARGGGGRARLPEHAPRSRRRSRSPAREVGWGPVDLHQRRREPALAGPAARSRWCCTGTATRSTCRAGAVHLASTPVCRHQAFRIGARAFGLQFHPRAGARDDRGVGARRRRLRARRARPRGRRAHPRRHRSPLRRRRARSGIGCSATSSRSCNSRRTVAAPSSFKIGLVQMRCSADPDDNLARAVARIARGGRAAARRSSACRSCSARSTSARARTARCSTSPSRSPARPPRRSASVAQRAGRRRSSARSSSGARPGVYHNTAVVLDADGSLLGLYRKMHIPDDPLYYEKFYFTPGDLGFRAFDTRFGQHRHAGLLGPVVSRRRRGSRRCRAREVLFYPDRDRLAPAEKARVRRGAARRLGDDPARARDRQRRLRRGGQPRRPRRAGRTAASSSGAARSSPIRSGVVLAEALARRGRDPGRRRATRAHRRRSRRNWPFLRDRRIDAYGAITERFLDRAHDATSREHRRAAARLPHARRVGAARGHLDRLAAPAAPTGRASSAPIPWVYAEIVRAPRAAASASRILVHDAAARERARERARRASASTCDARRLLPRRRPTASGCATPARSSCSDARRRGRASSTGASTPGRSTTNWQARRRACRDRIAAQPGCAAWQPIARSAGATRVVLEGGGIDVNGEGLLLTTEECLLSDVQARNPGLDARRTRSACSRDYLGVDAGALARRRHRRRRHARPRRRPRALRRRRRTVVVARRGRPARREPRAAAREPASGSSGMTDRGRAAARGGDAADAARRWSSTASGCRRATRTSTSPTGWCWCRRSTIPNDRVALGHRWPSCFPTAQVVGIHAVDLVWGFGTLHCMTQQQPALRSPGPSAPKKQ